MISRRDTLLAGLATGMVGAAGPAGAAGAAEFETIELWPGTPPGAPATLPTETIVSRGTPGIVDRAISGIARPRLLAFRPAQPNGAALLVAPGGGYTREAFDHEGVQIAHWLTGHGWTVFVLLYRLPGEGWAHRADVPLADAQRGMRLIRARAANYRIDPGRVAMMGFSAGGHLCGSLATRHAAPVYAPVDAADRLSARPIIAAPMYAVQSMRAPLAHKGSRDLLLGPGADAAMERAYSNAANVSATTPPCFMVHAEDDNVVPVDNTIEMRAALKAAGIVVETHLFTAGGHGFGLRNTVGKPVAAWPDLFLAWAHSQGVA